MSDQERGAYTPPTDEPLAFDARRTTSERRPVPMTLVASAVVLVVLVVAVVLFYRSGVRSRNEAPNVGEPVAAVKTAPTQEAQPIDEAAQLDVYVADPNAPGAAQPTFAPGPEQPQPRPAPQATPPAPVAAPTTPVTSGALRPAQPAQTAPAAATPAAPAPKPAAPTPAAQAPTPAPAAAGGSAAVQIGAFSSTAIADAEFAKIANSFPQYASGKAKRVEPVERDGKTLYRTAFTGFSKADAQAFCSALKAAGKACLVK